MGGSQSYQWQTAAASLLFPQRLCLYCGALCAPEPLCPDCEKLLLELRRCPHCATFIARTEAEHYQCAHCRQSPPDYAAALAALPYTDRLRRLLQAFKYEGVTGLRRPLAAIMWQAWRELWPEREFDVIAAVPLHPDRLRERGYDQAQLLARLLAKESGLPYEPALLARVKPTPPLYSMDRRQRLAAMRGAFAGDKQARGLRILLTDDIFTTGATADTATRALLKAGAESVAVLTAAAGKDL